MTSTSETCGKKRLNRLGGRALERNFFIDSICLAVPFGKRYALIPEAQKASQKGK